MLSRAANHDRLTAKSRLAGSQGRKPAEPVARSASLDRLTPGRQSSSKRSWFGLTELVRQHDKVRRLALGALISDCLVSESAITCFSAPALRLN